MKNALLFIWFTCIFATCESQRLIVNGWKHNYVPLPAQNLLLYSEQLDHGGGNWLSSDISVTGNADGVYEMATITTSGSNRLNTDNGGFAGTPVTPGVTYTFSFEVKRGTATALTGGVYNFTGGTDIVASYDYYSLTNSSTYTRVGITFTAPAGCTGVWLYPLRNVASTGTVYVGKAWLYTGSKSYILTTNTIVP